MKQLHKTTGLLLVALFCLLVLAACSEPIPKGIDESAIKSEAQSIMELLHQRDYAAVRTALRQDIQDESDPAVWPAVYDQRLDRLGDFESYKNVKATAKKLDGGENTFVVVELDTRYQNGEGIYQVIFDDQGTFVGLRFTK